MESFENIKISFLSGISVHKIEFKEILRNLSWDDQELLIQATLLDERNVKCPLKRDYQISFIKHIIKQLEDNNSDEIHDQCYECLAVQINAIDSGFSFKHYKIDNSQYISIKEANSFIRDGTTGLKVWEASIMLSNYIIQNVNYFKTKSVIEIGSGCSGLVGLTLLKLCDCKQIFLSDCHESVINTLKENLMLNLKCDQFVKFETSLLVKEHWRVNGKTDLGILSIPWENVEELKEELSKKCQPDIILGADIIYDSSIFGALINCVNALFEIYDNKQLEFILSQTIRNNDTFEEFRVLLEKSNFSMTEISSDKITSIISLSSDASIIKIFKIKKMTL